MICWKIVQFGLLMVLTVFLGTSPLSAQTEPLPRAKIGETLIAEARGKFEFARRNISARQALRMVRHAGRVAAEITLSRSWGGHPFDWQRKGRVGVAQRFEYGMKKTKGFRPGRTVWATMSFYLPPGTVSQETTSLFDLKPVYGTNVEAQLLRLSIGNSGRGTELRSMHSFEQRRCIEGVEPNGSRNSFCDTTTTQLFFGPVSRYSGRWVRVVFRAVFDNANKGAFDMWIDGSKVMGYRGNTAHGADKVLYKFGLYRINMDRGRRPPPDIRAYFASVGYARSCARLGLPDCARLETQVGATGYTNIVGTDRYVGREIENFLARGGKVVK